MFEYIIAQTNKYKAVLKRRGFHPHFLMIEILADSLNTATNDRLTTFLLPRFWKLLQAELRTHRSLSQSHYSSRAVPISKVIEQIESDPFVPRWTRHKSGMSGSDTLTGIQKDYFTDLATSHAQAAIATVKHMQLAGVSKESANRYLEPWMHGPVILTGTSDAWEHFFKLRCAEGVQPDFRVIADAMRSEYLAERVRCLEPGDWHIPFANADLLIIDQVKVSSARCARGSYKNHYGDIDVLEDLKLHDRLVSERHMTPMEHQAVAQSGSSLARNLKGWMHYRQHIEEDFEVD